MTNTKIIINATQHKATEDQRLAGVVDLPEEYYKKLCKLLTFDDIPSYPEMAHRAHKIVIILDNAFWDTDNKMATSAMIGGEPFFVPTLENILKLHDWNPVVVLEDGSVRKENVFKRLNSYTFHSARLRREAKAKSKENIFKHRGFYEA